MVNGVGGSGSAARDAIMAAIKSQARLADGIQARAAEIGGGASGMPTSVKGADAGGFANELREGLAAIQTEMSASESIPHKLITGEMTDFHEVAVQLKKSDLSFRFALQVRNKLIDAYREVMRMNV